MFYLPLLEMKTSKKGHISGWLKKISQKINTFIFQEMKSSVETDTDVNSEAVWRWSPPCFLNGGFVDLERLESARLTICAVQLRNHTMGAVGWGRVVVVLERMVSGLENVRTNHHLWIISVRRCPFAPLPSGNSVNHPFLMILHRGGISLIGRRWELEVIRHLLNNSSRLKWGGGGRDLFCCYQDFWLGFFFLFFKKNVDLCADRSSRGAAVKASEAMTEVCT